MRCFDSMLARAMLMMALWAMGPLDASAQWLEGVEIARDGDDAVLELQFSATVQLLDGAGPTVAKRLQFRYQLTGSDGVEFADRPVSKRLGAKEGLPPMFIEDRAGTNQKDREIVVAFRQAQRAQVKAGSDARSIRLILAGVGKAVKPTVAPLVQAVRRVQDGPALSSEGRFVIVLTRVGPSDPPPIIDSSLQNLEVFTRVRKAEGGTQTEWIAGYFPSLEAARAFARQLSRFPDARAASASDQRHASAQPEAPAPKPGQALPGNSSADLAARSRGLFDKAQAAYDAGEFANVIDLLDELLNLPANEMTPSAMVLAGQARVALGDLKRARIEFETYLSLYPKGEQKAKVSEQLAKLGELPARESSATASAQKKNDEEAVVTASASTTYFGGNGRYRSQEFQESVIGGLPQAVGEELLSPDRTSQVFTDVDLRWRQRNLDREMRWVFRDAYLADLERANHNRHRLSAMYFDYRSFVDHYDIRLGRQSPRGGGVMGRFDGARVGYQWRPDWKLSAVTGRPTDSLFETKRHFYGAGLDVDRILPNFGAGLYAIEQRIDGQSDRRALGVEARYFKGGAAVFSQLDYDTIFHRLNIASVQGNWFLSDDTSLNALYDRRALTLLTLGNSLTFIDPNNPVLPTTLSQQLAQATIEALRARVRSTTPFIKQASVGASHKMNDTWRASLTAQSTDISAIPPIPDLPGYEAGRPASGTTRTLSASMIGLNLLTDHDLNVFTASLISGNQLDGYLLAWTGSYYWHDHWQIEPTIQYYQDAASNGGRSTRWSPGLRLTRRWKHFSVESNLTWELGDAHRIDLFDSTRSTQETSNRLGYSLGVRYDF